MKNKYLYTLVLGCLLLSARFASAQQNVVEPYKINKTNEPFVYECTTDITVYAYDFIGQKMDIAAAQIVPEGCLFNIVDAFPPDTLSLKSRVCVIKLSNKTTNLSQRYQARTIISANNAVYYVMKMSDILYKVRKKYDKVLTPTVGVAFVPIKIRLKLTENDRFDFSQDIMLGTSIGLRKRIDAYLPYYQTSLLSIGITSVVADSATTKGYIKEGNTKLAAFTPSLGSLWEFNDIQLGLFLGADWIGSSLGDKWIYQGKPWLSIGIGYQLFGKPK